MTPVERIEAALEKLEQLRSESDPVRSDSEWVASVREIAPGMLLRVILDTHNGGYDGSVVAGDVTTAARAELIVTLHRTIDAQLDTLRLARGYFGAAITGPDTANAFADMALALADAILGSDS